MMVKAVVSVMVAVALLGSVYCGEHGLGLQLGLAPYTLQVGGLGYAAGGHDGYLANSLIGGYSGGHGLGGYSGGHNFGGYSGAHVVAPYPQALNLDAGYDTALNLGHGHAHIVEPVVKKVVAPVHLEKTLATNAHATYNDYDTNAFVPLQKPVYHEPHHNHHHHDDHYHGGSDFSIVPSISYGYSYKLIPTDSFGHYSAPVHHQTHDDHGHIHGQHGHDGHGHGSSFGLDLGLGLGGGHHHH